MNIVEYNRAAWNHQVLINNRWTIPVSPDIIEKAIRGDWDIVLTPIKSVPKNWFPDLYKKNVLCLASGGGQQGPILAAAGANVTVFDLSDQQLAKDVQTAKKFGLPVTTVQGEVANLSFADSCFDIIINPVSSCFFPKINPVWKECARVLKPDGILMTGFYNPAFFIFDDYKAQQGLLEARHPLPYSDEKDLLQSEKEELIKENEPFVFSHTLTDLIAGQTKAGFHIIDLYEDSNALSDSHKLDDFIPSFIATLAKRVS